MKEGKDIDKLFKDGLGEPDLPFNDLDWDHLEERLHPAPKRRVVPLFWLSAAAGIAAMLLIVFLLVKPNHKIGVIEVRKADKENQNTKPQDVLKPTEIPTKKLNPVLTIDSNQLAVSKKNIGATGKAVQRVNPDQYVENDKKITGMLDNDANMLANVQFKPELGSKMNQVEFKGQDLITSVAIGKPERIKAPLAKQKSRFVLSILAAPDLTGVQKSGRSSLSGSFGLEATYILSKKLSITTGAAYAKKIYDSDFSLYNPNTSYVFKIAPSNIHANCDVIDIPLNVNYKVFGNNRNAVSVSTGLSSYIMLKERYTYAYDGAYQGPQGFEVKGRNQHYMGIANIGIEFQHKINNNLSISAKPFMKIPLTDIGYGNSKLSSTGVAVSVNMNLFKKN